MEHFEWLGGCVEQASWNSYQAGQGGTNHACLEAVKYVLPIVIAQELDVDEKQCVCMYYFEHFTQAQIAAALGTSQSAVSRKLVRAKKKLEKYLDYSMIAAKKASGSK